MSAPEKTYLGDGLYAHDDGMQIILSTERENGLHWVALEPMVLDVFLGFLERACKVKITVTNAEGQSADEPRAWRPGADVDPEALA